MTTLCHDCRPLPTADAAEERAPRDPSQRQHRSEPRSLARIAIVFRRCLVGIAAFHLLAGGVAAERVVRVTDGDSIVVESGENEINVRIADIDAPELDQTFGEEAKSALSRLLEGRRVRLELVGGDAYRRIVANVFVEERDVAAELVTGGFAWVRRAYAPASRLIDLEESARDARRGLWAGDAPTQPWIWRKTRGHPKDDEGRSSFEPISPDCGSKHFCSEMRSCEEALAFLRECGLETIDGDGDGIPCESMCKYYR